MPQPSDEAPLLERFRAGDAEAFRLLVAPIEDLLRVRAERWMSARLGRRLSASDVTQEALLVAFERRADFEDRGEGSFRKWLLGIVEMKCREAIRWHEGTEKRTARREVSRGARPDTAYFPGGQPTPSQGAMAKEAGGLVRRALEDLSPDYREVLRLAREEMLPFAQVAERMGRSCDAVKKLYSRAVLRFQESLERLRAEEA